MSDVSPREQWIEAARQVSDTGTADGICPVNGDAKLRVDWIPAPSIGQAAGEYRIWCPGCGAENYIRKGP